MITLLFPRYGTSLAANTLPVQTNRTFSNCYVYASTVVASRNEGRKSFAWPEVARRHGNVVGLHGIGTVGEERAADGGLEI